MRAWNLGVSRTRTPWPPDLLRGENLWIKGQIGTLGRRGWASALIKFKSVMSGRPRGQTTSSPLICWADVSDHCTRRGTVYSWGPGATTARGRCRREWLQALDPRRDKKKSRTLLYCMENWGRSSLPSNSYWDGVYEVFVIFDWFYRVCEFRVLIIVSSSKLVSVRWGLGDNWVPIGQVKSCVTDKPRWKIRFDASPNWKSLSL